MSTHPFCRSPFGHLRVTCEGEAFFCCYQREQGIGNILSSSLDEVWFGKIAEAIRQDTEQGTLHPICEGSGCPYRFSPELEPSAPQTRGYPVSLEIDLPNTHCNIGGTQPSEKKPACLMCERSMPGYRFHSEDRLPEVLPKLLPLMPSVNRIHVQGIAEGFWKDYLFKVLDLLQFDRWKNEVMVSTVTNGLLLDKNRRRKFLERCPISSVAFSLDSATPETYRKIRRVDAYELVTSHLMAYSKERKRHPGVHRLLIQNNINTLNLSEVVEMVRVAARAEVDGLVIIPTEGYLQAIQANEKNAPLFREARRSIEQEAQKLGVNVAFPVPLDLRMPTQSIP